MRNGEELVPDFYSETDDTLRLEIEEMAGVEQGVVIRMFGYLDGFNVAFFSRRVEKVIQKGYRFVSFDLENVSYVSSRGIGTFALILKTLKARGGGAHLCGVRPNVLEVFRVLGFLEYFDIGKSREEASAAFRKMAELSPAAFPVLLNCPVCGQLLKIPGAGRGRCPECKCPLTIDRNGRILAVVK